MQNLPGTYALILLSASDRLIQIGKLGRFGVPPGFWVYVGSACGPGGLKARIAHHKRIAQRPHWHMDYLRPALHLKEVWYTFDAEQHEHRWAKTLGGLKGACIPIVGFGASDCNCKAHLFLFSAKPSLRLFRNKLRPERDIYSAIFKCETTTTKANGNKQNIMDPK